jgi:beta-phosphoglucomutase-like phosphatase (HAD superfamily)
MSERVRAAAPALVIFDCDGVLVDSEIAFARALAECLQQEGFPADFEEALVLGFGSNRASLAAAVEAR